jgi:uncharacterized protein
VTLAWLPSTGVGFIGGTLVGMTGVGAGSVIAALLLIAYPSLSPQLIVGSATAQAVVMKLFAVGARRHMKLGEMRLGLSMAAGAAPLAIAGAFVSHGLHAVVLKTILAVVLAVVGTILIIQSFRRWRSDRPHVTAHEDPPVLTVGVLGSLVGFVAGLTSIGTGTLFVSALVGPLRVDAHRAVAAALVAGLVTLVISAVTHLALGHVTGALVVGTCVGSVPGVLLGTMLATRLPAQSLRGAIGGGIVIAAGIALARLGK